MSYHSKRRITNTAIYLTLALTVVAIVLVTVFTFASAHRKNSAGLPEDGGDSDGNAQTSEETDPDDGQTSAAPEEETSAATDNDKTSEEDRTDTSGTLPDGDADADTEPQPDDGADDLPTDGDTLPTYLNPVKGYVLKEFSIDLPIWSSTMEDYRTHSGIDISAAVGDPVTAIANGLVKEVSDDPLMGRTVVLEHDGGLTSVYQNLADEDLEGIAPGVLVTAGQVIGAVGDSALAETAESEHLHFSLAKDGEAVNPLDYLDYTDADAEDSGNE